MNSAKIGVGLLTVMTIAVVAYVFVAQGFMPDSTTATTTETTMEDLNPPGDGPPRIAILTQSAVKNSAILHVPSGTDDPEIEEKDAQQAANALMGSTMDYLSSTLTNSLTRTGRLEVVESTRIERIMREIAAEPEDGTGALTNPNYDSENESTSRDEDGVLRSLSRRIARDLMPRKSTPTDDEPPVSEAELELANAVEQLGASYVLVVYVTEPKFESFIRNIPDTDRHLHVVRAAPTISYSLFHAATGTVLLADVTQQDTPLEFVYGHDSVPNRSDILREQVALEQRNAEKIVRNILDTLFPAQISLVDPADPDVIVMDRGARDGIQVDDVFKVSRSIGQAVGANNIALAEEAREPVGEVRVVRVQDTLAFVRPESGGPFVRQDIIEISGSGYDVRRNGPQSANASGATGASVSSQAPAPALGIDMIETERAGVPDNRPRIAVREVSVSYIDCASCEAADPGKTLMPRALLNELQNEQRIIALSRQDMEALIQERNFADSSAGRNMRLGVEGMTSAHYILTGDATITPRTRISTDRVAGKEVETGRSTTLTVSGLFRILDAETSQLVKSSAVEFTLSGGTSQSNLQRAAKRAAELANADLMKQLFPLVVLEVKSNQEIELSSGQQAGLQEGMRLQAFAISAPVDDIYGGRSEVGRTKSGILVVTDVRADRATARFQSKAFDLKRLDQLEVIPGRASSVAAEPVKQAASQASPPPASQAAAQPATPAPSEDLDDF